MNNFDASVAKIKEVKKMLEARGYENILATTKKSPNDLRYGILYFNPESGRKVYLNVESYELIINCIDSI